MSVSDPTTPGRATPLVDHLLASFQALDHPTRQQRTTTRLLLLTLGHLLTMGRHTITQLLVTLGVEDHDWTAWYRLFSRQRVRADRLHAQVVEQLGDLLADDDPFVVALDATQLPRTSHRMPGTNWGPNPRNPGFARSVHRMQRVELLSGLLPLTATGESRAVPIRSIPLCSAKTIPIRDIPPLSEGAGAIWLLHWLRHHLAPTRPILAVADGAYSTAPVFSQLPATCWLLARCAKNRALFALPTHDPHQRGRHRKYGPQGPTPQETLHARRGWQRVTLAIRGRTIPLTVQVTGPWLVKPVPTHPVFLIVVKGIERTVRHHRRQRDPQFFLVSANADGQLPLPVATLLSWAWQRWEVEVMHRELKSSFGFGQPQVWQDRAVVGVIDWQLWTYAQVILAATACWGLGSPPGRDRGGWYQARRWSIGRALQEIRAELWDMLEIRPGWARSPDAWAEMEAWKTTQMTAVLGYRAL